VSAYSLQPRRQLALPGRLESILPNECKIAIAAKRAPPRALADARAENLRAERLGKATVTEGERAERAALRCVFAVCVAAEVAVRVAGVVRYGPLQPGKSGKSFLWVRIEAAFCKFLATFTFARRLARWHGPAVRCCSRSGSSAVARSESESTASPAREEAEVEVDSCGEVK
jgi:hypothetical protein